ncbi:translocase of inner mitochondrial membrane 13 [Cricetulus griseus]
MVDAVVIMVLQKKVPDLGDSSNSRDGDDPGGRDEELAGALPKPLVPLRSPVHMTRNSNLFAFPKSRCQEGLDSGKHCGVKSGGLPEFFALLENGTMRSGVHTERGVLIKQWTPVTHGVAFPSQVQFNSEEKPPDFAGFSLNLILHIHVLKTTKTLSHCAFYSIYSNVLASGGLFISCGLLPFPKAVRKRMEKLPPGCWLFSSSLANYLKGGRETTAWKTDCLWTLNCRRFDYPYPAWILKTWPFLPMTVTSWRVGELDMEKEPRSRCMKTVAWYRQQRLFTVVVVRANVQWCHGERLRLDPGVIMEQMKVQIAVANAQELLQRMTDKCFRKCIGKPGGSLNNSEQKCIAMCMDRYMDAWNTVSRAYNSRLQRERANM